MIDDFGDEIARDWW